MNIADVLSGDAKLKGIRWVLRSSMARKVLRDRLRTLLPTRLEVGPCRLREAQFKLGRKLTAYYDVLVQKQGTDRQYVRPIAVSWGSASNTEGQEETDAPAKVQAEAVSRGVAAPFRQLMADYPDWGMHVRVSPLDPRFTQLVRLSDPGHVRGMLAEACAPEAAASNLLRSLDYKVAAIKYQPGRRHMLRYDAQNPAKGPTVFAKLYIAEERARAFRREDGAPIFGVARNAADWLAEHGEGVNCVRPLAYVAADAAILYLRVAGTPLSDHAQRSGCGAMWFQRAGAALRALQRLPVDLASPLRPPIDFAAEIRSIKKKSAHIPVLLPQVGSALEALLDRARELHERLPQEPPSFTHGDFKSEHIWVAAESLTLIDFDDARLGDPALDMGHFLADWQFSQAACSQAEREEVYQSFLAGYAPGAPKERFLRARLYEAIELVRCALRRVQLFEDDWVSRTAGLVGSAQAVINDLQRILGCRSHFGTSVALTRAGCVEAGS